MARRRAGVGPSAGHPGTAIESSALRAFGAQVDVELYAAFEVSQNAMTLADDQRRFVSGNAAACRLLGVDQAELPWLSMDAFTSPGGRRLLDDQWNAFLGEGAAEGWYELLGRDRGLMRVEFSAIAHVMPNRHLSVFIQADPEIGPPLPLPSDAGPSWAPVVVGDTKSAVLTQREREVMKLVAAGARTADIAAALFVSPATVKSHIRHASDKLKARTRAHAVAISLVTGRISWTTEDLDPSTSGDGP